MGGCIKELADSCNHPPWEYKLKRTCSSCGNAENDRVGDGKVLVIGYRQPLPTLFFQSTYNPSKTFV